MPITHSDFSYDLSAAKSIIYKMIKTVYGPYSYTGLVEDDIIQEWYVRTGNSWRAIFGTTLGDSMHYEVVYEHQGDDKPGEFTVTQYKRESTMRLNANQAFEPMGVRDTILLPETADDYMVRPTDTAPGISQQQYDEKMDKFLKGEFYD